MKLLTTNTKLLKTETEYLPMGLQLAPADEARSDINLCSHATRGCKKVCIFRSGRGSMPNVVKARVARTLFFVEHQVAFFSLLDNDIVTESKRAERKGLKLCVRLNMFSDVPWEVALDANSQNVFERHPEIRFWDYTKNHNRMASFIDGKLPPNYHLTFSRAETKGNQASAKAFLANGVNSAYVFRESLPATFDGFPVINGDESDLRFLDPSPCIVGLIEKGKKGVDNTGFIIDSHL